MVPRSSWPAVASSRVVVSKSPDFSGLMLNKKDPHYGAMLIEQARLHLGTVMAGQDSEPFFMAMLQIAEAKVHLGYMTLRNKEVRLKGIKDFLQSVYYGLGIKDLNGFLANVVKSSLKEKSRSRYAYQFIEWLRTQDPDFQFPQEYFEYRRIIKMIYYNKRIPKKKKMILYKRARFIYNTHPSLLQDIGWDRKYKTVESCFYEEGFGEKQEILKPIKTYRNPTDFQVCQLADSLFRRLGKGKSRKLALELMNRVNSDEVENHGD